jgi:hypothetical protein
MFNTKIKAVIATTLAAFSFTPVKVIAATCDPNSGISGGLSCAGGKLPSQLSGSGSILMSVVNLLIGVVGIISVIMVIIGAIQLTLSSGNSDQVKKAKDTILFAIIGVVIALLAFAIVNYVLANIK